QMEPIDALHQRQLLSAHLDRLVVIAAARQVQQLALLSDRQPLVIWLHHPSPCLYRERRSPRAKKSRSTVSSPILISNSSRIFSVSGSPPFAKIFAASRVSCFFHCPTTTGWIPNRRPISARLSCSCAASSATRALNDASNRFRFFVFMYSLL